MDDMCKSPVQEKVLNQKINAMYAELSEYRSMVDKLYDFKNKLRGANQIEGTDCEKSNEPINFVDKFQNSIDQIRMTNSEMASILSDILEIL